MAFLSGAHIALVICDTTLTQIRFRLHTSMLTGVFLETSHYLGRIGKVRNA
jgi:hypothetical protein